MRTKATAAVVGSHGTLVGRGSFSAGATAIGPVIMKKSYVKPTLVKRGKLTERTAQIVASGIILGE